MEVLRLLRTISLLAFILLVLPCTPRAEEVVDPRTGRITLISTDLEVQAGPLTLAVKRTLLPLGGQKGLLGDRWCLNWESRLMKAESMVVLMESGSAIVFREKNTREFTGPSGDRLSILEGGRALLKGGDGGSTLFDREGRVEEKEDKHGNKTNLYYGPSGLLDRVEGPNDIHLKFTTNSAGQISLIESSIGTTVRYAYQKDKLTSVQVNGRPPIRYRYNNSGFLVRIENSITGAVDLSYDALGRVTNRQWEDESEERFEFDDTRRTVRYISPSGGVTSFCRTEDGRKEEITDPQGNKTVVEYNENLLPLFVAGPTGATSKIRYDAQGRLAEVTGVTGSNSRFEYFEETSLYRSIIEGDGTRYDFIYDNKHNLLSVKRDGEPINEFTYFSNGLIKSSKREGIPERKYMYYPNGLCRSETDSLGWTTMYEYDSRGNRVKEVNPLGRATVWTYDEQNRVMSSTDPAGATTRYEYDAAGRLIKIVDPKGSITQLEYDSRGRTISIKDPIGRITRYEYNSSGQLISESGADGSTYRYEYDISGNLVREINPLGGATIWAYNPLGQVIKESSPLGKTQHYIYSTAGMLTQNIGPSGEVIKYEYDALARLKALVDPKGRATRYEYDRKGRVVRVVLPDGGVSSYGYGPLGNLAKETHNRDVAAEYIYDGEGKIIKERWADGLEIAYEYDGLGNLLRWRDNLGGDSRLKYNPQGLLTEMGNASGAVHKYEYDLSGRMVAAVDPLNNATQLSYNPAGDLIQVNKASGDIAKYFYDPAGNMSEIHHPAGGVTRLTYDPMGNLLIRENPISAKTRYAYDKAGQLISETDAKGQTTTLIYDDSGGLSQKRYADGAIVKYHYDADGNLLGVDDGLFPIRYSYNPRGLLTRIDYPAIKRTLQYEYDETGLLMKFTNSEGQVITYQYDRNKRLSALTLPDGQRFSFEYDAKSRLISQVYPNGIKGTWEYDAIGRLTRISYLAPSGKVISGWRYSHDAANNLISVTDIQGNTTRYQYDNIYQINEEVRPTGTIRYTYLPGGNRGAINRDGKTVQYAYNRADQLLKAGEETFQYDANGNLVERSGPKGVTRYQYDRDNRLIKVTKSDGKEVSFGYAPTGERIWRKDSTGLTYFVTDGTNVLAELDDKLRPKSTYVHGPGIDKPLMLQSQGQSHFYHTDFLGSVTALTDHTGALSVSYETDAFGNLLDQKGAVPNPFIFTAREYESEIGLYYYRARYYDPAFARFLNRDPQWDEAKLNQYAYALNAPTRYRDPLGLWETDEEILRNHGLTWETFRKRLVAPEERKIRLMGLDRRIPGEGSSWTPKQYAERLLLNRLNDMKQELRGEYAIKSLRKGIAQEIRDYRSYNRLSRDEQAFAMIRMERALAKLESAAPEAPARAAEAQAQPARLTKIDTGGGAPPRPGVPTGKHDAAQPGSAPSGPKPPAPAAPGGGVVAKSQPSSPCVVVNPQPGKGVNPTPRYLGPQGSNTGADNHNWQKISTKPTVPPTAKEPFLDRFLKPDPNAGIVLTLVLTTEKIFQCRNAGMSAGDCAYEMLKAAAVGAPIALAALTVPYAGGVIIVVGGVAMTIKGFNDLVEYGYGREDARDAQNRLESILKERGQWAKVFKEARLDDDLRKMKERIEIGIEGLVREHKAACNVLQDMLRNAPQWRDETEEIKYRIPSRETIGRWNEVANSCKKAQGKKGIDEELEKLRNETQKNGRDLASKFKRAEALAGSCQDPLDASEISNAIKSCEDDFTKIRYRIDEAKRLGKDVKEFETQVKNTQSELNAALKDWDKLIALKKSFPSLKTWEEKITRAASTKEALLNKAKELDQRVRNLQMSYEGTLNSDEEYKFYELRQPLKTIEIQTCDIEAIRKAFNDAFHELDDVEETDRLRDGMKLSDELSECLKAGRMAVLGDIDKVQMEADKMMAGIPRLEQAVERCSEMRFLICADFKRGKGGEPLGLLEIGSKKRSERMNQWHVVLGGPYQSQEEAEAAWLGIAQGSRPYDYSIDMMNWDKFFNYISAGGRKCLVDPVEVQNLLKKSKMAVSPLREKKEDDLKPKENEWFVYVNVVDRSGNGIPTASVYSHDIGGYQSKNLGGGRFQVGPFWKRSPTDKRSIEIRAEVMFRSAQSFAYMPKYKNVPVPLGDQSIVEVTIQFTEEGDFMKDDRPSFISESSVDTKGDLKPPSFVRDSSVEPGSSLRTPGGREEAEEEPPEFIKRSVPRTTIGKSTVGATSPASPGVRPELRTPENQAQPPTTPQGQCVDKNGRPTLLCTEFNAPLSR